jgi:hypothetical protein
MPVQRCHGADPGPSHMQKHCFRDGRPRRNRKPEADELMVLIVLSGYSFYYLEVIRLLE